jgi:hypothetical protein
MGIEPVCCTKEMFDVVLTRNFMKSQAALRVSMLTPLSKAKLLPP